jgi:membrane-associated phospholipid phosphatase
VVLCGLALAVLRLTLGRAGSLDSVVLHAVNAGMARLPFIDFQAQLFNEGFAQLVVAAAAVALWCKQSSSHVSRARILLSFAVSLLTYGVACVVQHLGHRMAPMVDQQLKPLGDAGIFNTVRAQMSHWGSLPSDHSALLAIATLVAFMVGRRTGVIALFLSLYSCLFRIGYGYNWPSDIAAGIILGAAFCLLGLRLRRRLRPTFENMLSFIDTRPGISAAVVTVVVTECCDGFRYLTFFAQFFLHTRPFH